MPPFSLKQYTRGNISVLKITEQDEPITFAQTDYDHINTGSDSFFVTQTGSNTYYSVFNFKNAKSTVPSGSAFSVKCILKSNRATTGAGFYSPIYLELYNIEDSTWDNIYTNASTGSNGLFTIEETQSTTPGKYYSTGSDGSGYWLTARLYQRGI